jgi:hypothetical protein
MTANMFSEKDDIHDFASLRHALLEQVDILHFLVEDVILRDTRLLKLSPNCGACFLFSIA